MVPCNSATGNPDSFQYGTVGGDFTGSKIGSVNNVNGCELSLISL